MKNIKTNYFFLLTSFCFVTIVYLYQDLCSDIVLIEYFKHYFLETGRLENVVYKVQFVNDTSQNSYCYFTLHDQYFDIYENRLLYYTYFPRFSRVLVNQVLLLIIFWLILVHRQNIKSQFNQNYYRFLIVFIVGLVISINLINFSINTFEDEKMMYIYIFFSFLKCLMLYLYLKSEKLHLLLLILCMFPITSTGFGIPWFYDLLIYYLVFYCLNLSEYKISKIFILVASSLLLSLIYPQMNSPSLETQIVNGSYFPTEIENFNSISKETNTYLETKDFIDIFESQLYGNTDELEKQINSMSRNLKDIGYPGRYKYLISTFPDLKYHLPAFFWYLSLAVLLNNIFTTFKSYKTSYWTHSFEKAAKVLFIYQFLSLFVGINTFFNSFSSFIFSLSRNAELITFGTNQTWRGIADHYELFTNLQLLSFCFYLITFYLTKKNIYFLFTIISILTTFLSQSRWTTILIFIFLGILLLNFVKKFGKQLLVLVLFSVLIIQYIPVFEREDPFFVYKEGTEPTSEVRSEESYSLGAIEPITNRLNRTMPWKMFASGYSPDTVSLIFGHGPGSYLNIVKNSKTLITSGPHSSLLLLLNKFGVYAVLITLLISIRFLIESYKSMSTKNLINLLIFSVLLISLEIKTDSLLLMDGVAVFSFNLFLIFLLKNVLIENYQETHNNIN